MICRLMLKVHLVIFKMEVIILMMFPAEDALQDGSKTVTILRLLLHVTTCYVILVMVTGKDKYGLIINVDFSYSSESSTLISSLLALFVKND